MCLINSHYLPKLAIRDIPVKKLLLCENGRLITPYVREPIISTILNPKNRFYKMKDVIRNVLNSEIGCGFIHSYPSTAKTSTFPNANDMIVSPPFILVNAIIPKGSWYYTAKVRGRITEYASTKLILKLNKLYDSPESKPETVCTLKVMLQPDAAKFPIIKYLVEKFGYSSIYAENLVWGNSTFDLSVPYNICTQTVDELTLLKCDVKQI